MSEEDDAFWQGALNCCAVAVTIFFVIWVIVDAVRPSCSAAIASPVAAPPKPAPVPAPVQTTEDRQELLTRQLCDKEVAILLESRDLKDLIRAATVIHQVNCGIENRL